MVKTKLKLGDIVVIIAGKNKGSEGKILHLDREKGSVIVEGANMIKKHAKPNKANQSGGLIEKEAPIHISNVMYLHQNKPTRLGYRIEAAPAGSKKLNKVRIAVSTGDVID
ncbi:MAG: 50S ribosomal protein L24 [Clostridiales bacterium]|nr:50S ribosomal protein L24 [Clostridiales bacterium]